MAPTGRAALTALLFGVALLPTCHYLARAEDEAGGEEVSVGSDSEAEVAGEADPEKFMDSAKELQDKLAQLKELLAERGDQVDPELAERLSGLQKQLGSLGGSLGLDGGMGQEASKELKEFLGGCVSMAMRRAGLKKPATMSGMRRLATDGFTKDQGQYVEFVKLVAVCINELSDTELSLYRSGKMTQLSKAMEDKAKSSEGSASVLAIDDNIWEELTIVAKGVVKGLGGEAPKADPVSSTMGLLALVPILGAVGFLAKKFLDMQKENEAKKTKKTKKQK